jgi:hypothetical protein
MLDLLCICSVLDLLYVGSALSSTCSVPDLLCICSGSALCWTCSVLDLLCVGSALCWICSEAVLWICSLCVGSALCWICSVLDLLCVAAGAAGFLKRRYIYNTTTYICRLILFKFVYINIYIALHYQLMQLPAAG